MKLLKKLFRAHEAGPPSSAYQQQQASSSVKQASKQQADKRYYASNGMNGNNTVVRTPTAPTTSVEAAMQPPVVMMSAADSSQMMFDESLNQLMMINEPGVIKAPLAAAGYNNMCAAENGGGMDMVDGHHNHQHNKFMMSGNECQSIREECEGVGNEDDDDHHHSGLLQLNLNDMLISDDGLNHDNLDYFKYQQQPQTISQQLQQQVWVPRDELMSPPTNQQRASCHGQPSSGNYVPSGQQQQQQNKTLTLCNGKELPADLHNINPAFTIRRHFIQIQEEQKQIETLKKTIESKLKIQLPSASSIDEIGVALADGVILCHLMNQIFPRAVQIIHVPSLAMVT